MNCSEKELYAFLEANREALFATHKELCLIPAPSHFEDARAAYCKAWLEKAGAEGVYIDEAKNVVYPMNCEGSNRITVAGAHTDTVFPMETPLHWVEDGEYLRCPGVGDDTACLTVMLFVIKYLIEKKYCPKDGILFVCNSCEEGLGNLKGTRQIFKDYEGRILQHVAIDGELNEIFNRCVGSHRYEVTVKAEGGHSYSRFGNTNAIAEAARIISAIYELKVPEKEGTRTTYNVGTITGGTSVNTIAQTASFLCEYRSDDTDAMDVMKNAFEKIFSEAKKRRGVELEIKLVGERPCAKGVDEKKVEELTRLYSRIVEEVTGKAPQPESASTDSNIPLSLGIPSVCVGAMDSGGTHTTEEWLKKDSMPTGFLVVAKFISELMKS